MSAPDTSSTATQLQQHNLFQRQNSVADSTKLQKQQNQTLQYTAHIGFLYVYNNQQLHVIDTKQAYTDSNSFTQSYWTLQFNDGTQLNQYNITSILVNSNATLCALYSRNSIHIVQLPTQYSSNYNTIKCNIITINSHYFNNVLTSILQLQWSHLSASHIYVLTSNNVLRIFNCNEFTTDSNNQYICSHEAEYDLNQYHTDNSHTLQRSVRKSRSLQYTQYVSFTLLDYCQSFDMFNVYLLTSTGDISVLSPVLPIGCIVPTQRIVALIDSQKQLLQAHSGDLQAQHRIQYLRETFFLLGDNETTAAYTDTLISKPTLNYNDTRLVGPCSIGSDVNSRAISIITLHTTTLPNVLLKVYNHGVIVVLLQINAIQPELQSATEQSQQQLLSSIIPIEEIQLDVNVQQLQSQQHQYVTYAYDALDNNTLALTLHNQTYTLNFEWLTHTTQLLQMIDQHDDDNAEQLITALQAIQTDVTHLFDKSTQFCTGLAIMSHPLLGTVVTRHNNDNTLLTYEAEQSKLQSVQSTITTSIGQPEQPKQFNLSDYNILPFKQQIDYFTSKYNKQYKITIPQTLRGEINIRDYHKLQNIMDQRKQYIDIYRDCVTVQTDILNRIDLLHHIQQQQQTVIDTVKDNISTLIDNQSTINKQINIHKQIQSTLQQKATNVLRTVLQNTQSEPITPAQLAFYTELKHMQNSCQSLQQRLQHATDQLKLMPDKQPYQLTDNTTEPDVQLSTQQIETIEHVLKQQNGLCQQLLTETHSLKQQAPQQKQLTA